MDSELDWVHQFCLSCDQQTDGATYCSETCRLADYDQAPVTWNDASTPSPAVLSSRTAGYPWAASAGPNYDSVKPTPAYSLSSQTQTQTHAHAHARPSRNSSHTSLSSMRSSSSTTTSITTAGALGALSAFAYGTASQALAGSYLTGAYTKAAPAADLSERVRSELRKYANSLEHGRQVQRRKSC